MDKDFEKWLKQDELFEYYNANPEQQADIYEDYQREKEYIEPKKKVEWVKWMVQNPEMAEKYYPLLVRGLKDRIKGSTHFETANIIQEIPQNFHIWAPEINKLSGKYREKEIKEYITLLNDVLHEWQFSTEIEQQAVESVRPYLTEQLEYWNNELKALPPQEKNTKFDEKSNVILTNLEQYNFSDYLKKSGLKEDNIFQLIRSHSGNELMPYTIALLSEIKFLDYFFKEFTESKIDGFKQLSKVFNKTPRRIKGNVNILNPQSKEDPVQYTSFNYTNIVKNELKGLR